MGTGMRQVKIAVVVLIALLVVFKLYLLPSVISTGENTTSCRVTKVIDGDTLYCSQGFGRELKIRLIGIDAPESKRNSKAYRDAERTGTSVESLVELGEKSRDFVRSRVPVGTEVRLDVDVQVKDKYGRTLAYVYLPDGTMLNELVVREGYAQVMTVPPNVRHKELLLKAQKNASKSGTGFWGNN
jgi:micrococcal nuclease